MTYKRVYAEVDISAIRHNILNVRKRTMGKVLVVIKANAYGHGAEHIARAVCDIADYFAVATIEESVALRKCGIETPILILGYVSPQYFDDLVTYDITQTIFDVESAQLLAQKGGKAHIAVDSGMSRIGFAICEESIQQVKMISQMEGINIEGIFTHFATADEKDKSFAKTQYERFMWFCDRLKEEGVQIKIRHIANSAAIIDMPNYSLDMVRSGIITYGLKPSEEVGEFDMIPAMTLKSHVVNVKHLPKGTPISYGGMFVTQRDSIIATIPVGYADGYPRALSNKGRVIIHNQYAPITGRVCMDQFMVDVTDIENVKIGDEVLLMGKEISADEIAALEGTINYEVVCRISDRVPRIYINE